MTTESGGVPPVGPELVEGQLGLPEGPLDMGRVSVAAKQVDDYLRAVGDELPIYRQTGLAPPLYGTAAALGLLLKTLKLPPGAIHSLQEVDTLAPIYVAERGGGRELRAVATFERPRKRAGLHFITAACHLGSAPHTLVLTGKSTVMVADAADALPHNPLPLRGRVRVGASLEPDGDTPASDLPVVSRVITQERLRAYAAASGDDNPLHLDAEFAAATRFGGIIAHGMLTLAFISEMMTASLGERWLTGGSLRVRFKGAAYLGDRVETWGRATKSNGETSNFAVGVRNNSTGEDLITGTATVKNN